MVGTYYREPVQRHDDGDLTTWYSVTAYSTITACITLGHLYPRGTNVAVTVNVELLLETLASEATRTGEWVNVIGYVKGVVGREAAAVQALMVWPAGPMDIQQYEAALDNVQGGGGGGGGAEKGFVTGPCYV